MHLKLEVYYKNWALIGNLNVPIEKLDFFFLTCVGANFYTENFSVKRVRTLLVRENYLSRTFKVAPQETAYLFLRIYQISTVIKKVSHSLEKTLFSYNLEDKHSNQLDNYRP